METHTLLLNIKIYIIYREQWTEAKEKIDQSFDSAHKKSRTKAKVSANFRKLQLTAMYS